MTQIIDIHPILVPKYLSAVRRNIKRHSHFPDRLTLNNNKHPYAIVDLKYKPFLQQFAWNFIPGSYKKMKGGQRYVPYVIHNRFTPDGVKGSYLHRVIWELEHGKIEDGVVIDHINGDGLDNRIENLRAISQSTNVTDCWSKRARVYRSLNQTKGFKILSDDGLIKTVEVFGENQDSKIILLDSDVDLDHVNIKLCSNGKLAFLFGVLHPLRTSGNRTQAPVQLVIGLPQMDGSGKWRKIKQNNSDKVINYTRSGFVFVTKEDQVERRRMRARDLYHRNKRK